MVLFVHMLGIVFWIGGALVALVVDYGVKGESAEVRAGVARQLARAHTMVIGLGALLLSVPSPGAIDLVAVRTVTSAPVSIR